jgi:hypothetical protein
MNVNIENFLLSENIEDILFKLEVRSESEFC